MEIPSTDALLDNSDLDVRPLKKAKCSESSDFESNKQRNECDPSELPPSPTILASCPKTESHSVNSSECSESSDFESNKRMNECDSSPLPSSPTITASSPKIESYRVNSSDVEKGNCHGSSDFETDKIIEKHEQFKVDETYDYLPQDYAMTDRGYCAQIAIESSLETDILVKIDEIYVTQSQLLCLLDPEIFLNDDVISAYICCMKDQAHLQIRNGLKTYFENPFISVILKRDGNLGIKEDGNCITKIVKNYLNHDMVLIPINIKKTHWYLAVINTQKCEIQVLDSLCWDFNRVDLTDTLQGLQYHLNIIGRQQNLINHNWKDLEITTWTIREQLQEPLQKDGSSCSLFMLKFMEYWTGDALSHPISQKDISDFRYKLAGILLCWKANTAAMIPHSEHIHAIEAKSNDVLMLGSAYSQKEPKTSKSLSEETKYQSLMTVLSKMSVEELVGGLCNYIKSINCAETLEKVWVQNSKPYTISLTLRKLQEILKEDLKMDCDCFNLAIRKFICDDMQKMKKAKGTISKHYLDTQFWMITDFGRHPNFRKKLDVEQLAKSICHWPGINYSVSTCKSMLIPIVEFSGNFILVILNQDTRTVYVLDPTPLDPIYQYNPNAKYVKKLLWMAEYLQKAMVKACPGSRWTEDIFLWRQIILPCVPILNRELSGYLVSLFMCKWKDDDIHLPTLKDGYEIRKHFMAQLLAYKDNECEDNMPAGVRDFIRCINATQS